MRLMAVLTVLVLSTSYSYSHTLAGAASGTHEHARVLYVDGKAGHDSNDGSADKPFKTIEHCAAATAALSADGQMSTVCRVLTGVYRETVNATSGLILQGHGSGPVVISGLEPFSQTLQWASTAKHCIFRAAVPEGLDPIAQLFYDGSMMVEARWPNIAVQNVGDAAMSSSAWRHVHNGSRYGKAVDPGLKVPFSWVGALATLNVGHQWDTWTRRVTAHDKEEGSFTYPTDLPGLAGYDATKFPAMNRVFNGCEVQDAKCNQYFLSGKLEALDSPGEWFHEPGTLYFYPPSCEPPSSEFEYKARDYAIQQKQGSDVHIADIVLHGATLQLANCTRCSARNLTLSYPTYDAEVRELNNPAGKVVSTLVAGQDISLRDVVLTQSNNNGLTLHGFNISLENCLISYTDWVGSLTYHPLGVTGNQMSVRRCTVREFGNAGVVTAIPNVPAALRNDTPAVPGRPQLAPDPMAGRRLEIAHTHIYNGARVGEDTAALYSGGWGAAGQIWHHNWVHDTTEKCLRFDDQSENATIHHNVVYNCGMPHFDPSSRTSSGVGLVAKGDGHLIYANTIFDANVSEMCLSNCVEKLKTFRTQYPRVSQNVHTQIFNTAARRSRGSCECVGDPPPGGNTTAVFRGVDLGLNNIAAHDYRPSAASPLVDAGAVVPPYTDGYIGKAPDIGAYERGGEWWRAGCEGLVGC